MASGSGPVLDDDELKGDGKKRKFKPLEAMRKLFGKGKRKAKDEQVSVVAVKAKSTTALHHHNDDDDDDDDGGFKKHQPRPLGGNRSISEDSIFSPDQREPNLQALKKAAVSEESLPKSAFQAELFSKLSKRRSQYSDEDDGLPHSPTPPVTTADIIMGGPLKPLPAAGKSTSRESDNSLISNDASDNEEDDPFKTQWKSSVPSKVSKTTEQPGGGAEAPIDFEEMGHTELLKSNIAKDRISIKPRSRKTNRQSRKQRESQSPHSLPSLNEESPPKPREEIASTSSMTESQISSAGKQEGSSTPSKPQASPVEKTAGLASHHPLAKSSESSPTMRRSLPMSSSLVHPPTSAPPEKKEATKEDKRASLSSDFRSPSLKEDTKEPSVRPSVKTSLLKEEEKQTGLKMDLKSPKSPTVKEQSEVKTSVDVTKSETESESRPKTLPGSKTMESLKKESDSDSSVSAGRDLGASMMSRSMCVVSSSKSSGTSEFLSSSAKPKVEFLSTSLRSSGSPSASPSPALQPDSKPVQATSPTVKTSTTAERTSSPVTSKPSQAAAAASPGQSRKDGLRPTDSQTSPAFSPKDDYKLRRQSRSKTLPEQPTSKEEPFAARVQRTASHRVEPTSSQNTSPETSPRHREKVTETSKPKEPEWFALARRKTGRQESDEKDSPSPTREATPAKETTSTSQGSVSTAPGPKEESTSNLVQTSSNISVSSAASKFGGESKVSEVSRFRGGSVKTSPTKTPVFANRGSSVKVQSVRSEPSTTSSSFVAASPLKTSAVPSATALSSASGAKQDEVKEDSKGSESSPLKEAPKWKTQSVKTPSAFSSGSSSFVSSSRFASVKAPSQTTPAPLTSTSAKTETKPVSSPAKTAPLNKMPSEEKDKPNVPAWRANLSQKKTPQSAQPPPSDIKIELIESASSKSSTTSAGNKEESVKKEESTKKEEPVAKVTGTSKDVQSDQCRSSAAPGRTSKVMNLLKNFENVPGVS